MANDANKKDAGKADEIADLCAALSALRNGDEMLRFLKDLTTPGELAALSERWRIAQLLHEGRHSYRDIATITGASTTTVARVARFLNDEPYEGYALLLGRLKKKQTRKSSGTKTVKATVED